MDIKIERNNVYVNWICCACGKEFELEAVIATAYVNNEEIGGVCPMCLKEGSAGIAQRMREHAAMLRQHAQALEWFAAQPINAPPFTEYQAQLA
jgi:hypothetical protein